MSTTRPNDDGRPLVRRSLDDPYVGPAVKAPTPEERERERLQASAAEVPGFDARTRIDDAMRKLWSVRDLAEFPDEIVGLLDDVDAATDRIVQIAHDPDLPRIATDPRFKQGTRVWSLLESGSRLGECSCGGIWWARR